MDSFNVRSVEAAARSTIFFFFTENSHIRVKIELLVTGFTLLQSIHLPMFFLCAWMSRKQPASYSRINPS